jgi:hypothetical protein
MLIKWQHGQPPSRHLAQVEQLRRDALVGR